MAAASPGAWHSHSNRTLKSQASAANVSFVVLHHHHDEPGWKLLTKVLQRYEREQHNLLAAVQSIARNCSANGIRSRHSPLGRHGRHPDYTPAVQSLAAYYIYRQANPAAANNILGLAAKSIHFDRLRADTKALASGNSHMIQTEFGEDEYLSLKTA